MARALVRTQAADRAGARLVPGHSQRARRRLRSRDLRREREARHARGAQLRAATDPGLLAGEDRPAAHQGAALHRPPRERRRGGRARPGDRVRARRGTDATRRCAGREDRGGSRRAARRGQAGRQRLGRERGPARRGAARRRLPRDLPPGESVGGDAARAGDRRVKLGFFGINTGVLSHPDSIARAARAADDAGYESLWTGEHVVLIDPQQPPSPVPPQTRFLDPVAALGFAAAHTRRVKLGTGIIILPQRNPVVLAKELASLDVLSGGRLIVGVGVGYVKGEFDALGIRFEERGPRTSEHVEVLRQLWTSERPRFDGRFTRFAGIRSEPRPVQRPHPPILVGGMSVQAYRRALLRANGWYGFALDPANTRKALDALGELAKRIERPAALGPLEVTITPPPGAVTRDVWKRYEDLGVARLVLLSGWKDMQSEPAPGGKAEDEVIAFLARAAEALT